MSRSSSSGCCWLVIFQHTWNAAPGERSDLTWTGWEKVGPNEQLSERVTERECTNVWLHVGPWCVMTITMEVWSPGPGLFLSLTWLSQCFQHTHTHTQTLFLHSTKRPPGCTHTHKSPSSVHICSLLLWVRMCVCLNPMLPSILRERGWAWLHDRWLLMNHIKLTLCLPDECLFALLVSLLWRTEAMCCLELFTGSIWFLCTLHARAWAFALVTVCTSAFQHSVGTA